MIVYLVVIYNFFFSNVTGFNILIFYGGFFMFIFVKDIGL